MKNIILIDGNNLLFRSYYATAYSGVIMKNDEGFPTNALYGFIAMINKIIKEENPSYMAVAFDIGKNFRQVKYENYKFGRIATPEDLKKQMPVARELLNALGIKYYEMENYEADDIIGTLAKLAEDDPDFIGTIISSDRDLLQLISPQIAMKLLKQKDFIRYNEKSFYEDYGFEPIHIIDFKALAGDASDNIPGVKGIGEKTALKLIQTYKTIENLYDHLDEIKGSIHDKLINDKDAAFFSKDIATIYCQVPINLDLEETIFNQRYSQELEKLYSKLGFKSLIPKTEKTTRAEEITFIDNIDDVNFSSDFAYYIECDQSNYHDGKILGMGVYCDGKSYYVSEKLIYPFLKKFSKNNKYTFDLKKNICLLHEEISNTSYDLMIASYIIGNITDDIASLINDENMIYDKLKKQGFPNLENYLVIKAKYIFETKDEIMNQISDLGMLNLFNDIEMPLISVLAKMELNGIKVDKYVLNEMNTEMQVKIDLLENKIYDAAQEIFNISSPKQLGEILFDKMKFPYGKKGKTGYSTDVNVLSKLIDYHPIIKMIFDYRNYKKIQSTYLIGLSNYIRENDLIHTIYKQNLARTGRLSSVEPNLQNIPVRDEEGRNIRKAFLPINDLFLSADYSQIELRLLAHFSNTKELIDAFKNGDDIHVQVASKLYNVIEQAVTKEMRKNAKAVVFGIIYGISTYGLSEGTKLTPSEAKKFIEKYFEAYPGIKEYMDQTIKRAYEQGYVKTLFNRRRNIDELKNKSFIVRQSGERIALNTPLQGTSADIIKMAMIKIDEEITRQNLKSKMILQVHDELIFDIFENEKEELENIVKNIMENVVLLNVPLTIGVEYGKNWYET